MPETDNRDCSIWIYPRGDPLWPRKTCLLPVKSRTSPNSQMENRDKIGFRPVPDVYKNFCLHVTVSHLAREKAMEYIYIFDHGSHRGD